MVKWKQSGVKKVMSIFPFCSDTATSEDQRSYDVCVCVSGAMEAYRQAGRVGVLQKRLENDGKVVLEETVAVQQLLQTFLCTEVP